MLLMTICRWMLSLKLIDAFGTLNCVALGDQGQVNVQHCCYYLLQLLPMLAPLSLLWTSLPPFCCKRSSRLLRITQRECPPTQHDERSAMCTFWPLASSLHSPLTVTTRLSLLAIGICEQQKTQQLYAHVRSCSPTNSCC